MKRFKQFIIVVYRNSAFLLLNILLIFVAIELIATVLMRVAKTSAVKRIVAGTTGRANDSITHYNSLSYYSHQKWSGQYWQEHKSLPRNNYHPYVIWRSPPFEGEMLKIDQNGIRQTPGVECTRGAKKLFLFGGSAMWGWGAPDWGTIPAYLHQHLQATSGKPICIVNFAENAYISTQNLIQLILLLEAGNVPDVVVFYDGVNEVFAANQSGRAMLHENYSDISARFEDAPNPLLKWFRQLNSFKLMHFVVRVMFTPTQTVYGYPPVDIDRLSDSLIRSYLNNYDIVKALAEAYGFEYYWFWQPHI
jgi:hypothetical protein